MDNSTRLQYLEAMGIDVWVSREQVPSEFSQFDPLNEESWHSLQQQVETCKQCSLSKTRTHTVFGEGGTDADWMLVGEAPSQNEDQEGRPFLGQSGYLLTEMLRSMALQREAVYITNVVKCSPPNNNDPKVEELKQCDSYLQQQIALVKPTIILAVGRVAAQALLGSKQSLAELREQPHSINGIPVIAVYHPAYLLRSLLDKRKAWQDLQRALKIYQKEKKQ